MISLRLIVLCVVALFGVAWCNALPRSVETRKLQSRLNVTLVESNMPTLWQVQAAELAEESYELQTSNSGRLQMISELFTTYHPYWYWDVALNATFVYHSSTQYYLNLTVNADSLYIFSTT